MSTDLVTSGEGMYSVDNEDHTSVCSTSTVVQIIILSTYAHSSRYIYESILK